MDRVRNREGGEGKERRKTDGRRGMGKGRVGGGEGGIKGRGKKEREELDTFM